MMLGELVFEGFLDCIEMGCVIDVGLVDMCEVVVEVGQQWLFDWLYEMLEVVQFVGVCGGDQGGVDFDDFYFFQGLVVFCGSGFQIDYQLVRYWSYLYQGLC